MQGAKWTQEELVPWACTDELDKPDPAVVAMMPSLSEIKAEALKKGVKYEDLLLRYRWDYGDPPQLYNLDAVGYESLMLGVFTIHHGPENRVCEKLKAPKFTDLELAFSRDGFHWHRPDRTSFLASTHRAGDWDRAYLHTAATICTVVGDKLYFYYGAWSGQSPVLINDMYAGGAIGVAFLRRDGFASLDADKKECPRQNKFVTPIEMERGEERFADPVGQRFYFSGRHFEHAQQERIWTINFAWTGARHPARYPSACLATVPSGIPVSPRWQCRND